MKGKVIQFQRSRQRFTPRHFLIEVEGIKTRADAMKMAGKHIEWKSPGGKSIKGYVSTAHGSKGLVRAIFDKGLPGQAVLTEVDIK
jgi:large subunit ribosomal protein L35Ae